MIRRPPRSTLFPYTTALPIWSATASAPWPRPARTKRDRTSHGPTRAAGAPQRRTTGTGSRRRSEEHTSELQSPCNLVCRLLLEKKKQKKKKNQITRCEQLTNR